jgi:hypothetical protein
MFGGSEWKNKKFEFDVITWFRKNNHVKSNHGKIESMEKGIDFNRLIKNSKSKGGVLNGTVKTKNRKACKGGWWHFWYYKQD